MARAGQHPDIGAGAKDAWLAGPQQHHPNLGMLEPDAVESVGQFDINAEIVGVELEIVALEQPALLVDVQPEGRDLAVDA